MNNDTKKYPDENSSEINPRKNEDLNSSININDAIDYHKIGEIDQAESIYKNIINIDPRNVDALYLLSLISYSKENYPFTIELLDIAINANPSNETYLLNQGNAFQKIGQFEKSIVCYNKAILINKNYSEAYYNKAISLHESSYLNAAIDCYNKAIELNPSMINAYYNKGNALKGLSLLNEALISYNHVILLNPNYANAYLNTGNILQELNQWEESIRYYDKAIMLDNDFAEAYSNKGVSLHNLKDWENAIKNYDKAISIKFDYAEAYSNKGLTLKELRDWNSSIFNFIKAIHFKPDYFEAFSNLGLIYKEIQKFDLSIINFNQAIEINPEFATAYSNRGLVLACVGDWDNAILNYKKAIELKPGFAEAYSNLGISLHETNQINAAIASYNKAILINPKLAEAYSNRGNAFKDLRKWDEAASSYKLAIDLKPNYAEAYYNYGNLLKDLKDFESAIYYYKKTLELNSEYEYLFGLILHIKMHICSWENFSLDLTELINKIRHKKKCTPCLAAIALPIPPEYHQQVASIWCSDKYPFNPSLGSLKKYSNSKKIKLGYFSSDFHNHATSFLIAELFELHNKNNFELFAFSYGIDSQDDMRIRLNKSFDHFINISELSDKAVAELSRKLDIHIAIDLKGLTQDSRLGIFSFKAAPIQVSYLGYPGSLSTSYMDYLIADNIIIPKGAEINYSEKIVYMPHCYQVNDRNRLVSQKRFTKEQLGLPRDSFVYCCFNNNYKINPDIFDIWAKILNSVDSSVLWLLEDNPLAVQNLKKEAVLRGVNPERLIFAKRMNLQDHLSRHSAADLFLDTFPCNAHTTASDALWSGLPVLTCIGDSFISRVAASLLHSVGLPELITKSSLEYELLAVELANNPQILSALKYKLVQNRLVCPLFDTPQFVKHIETAYIMMYDRFRANLVPDHIKVAS